LITIYTNEDDWMQIYNDGTRLYDDHLNLCPIYLSDLLIKLGFEVKIEFKEF